MSAWRDPASGDLRLISLAGAQASFEAGPQLVAVVGGALLAGSPIVLNSGIAVDAYGNKLALSLQSAEDITSHPEPDLSDFGVYPNPLPIGMDLNLDLPLVSLKSIELFDSIGRRLWVSRSFVRSIPGRLFSTPGTYFVRITAASSGESFKTIVPSGVQPVVVVR